MDEGLLLLANVCLSFDLICTHSILNLLHKLANKMLSSINKKDMDKVHLFDV